MISNTLMAPILIEVLVLVVAHTFARKTKLIPQPGATATIVAGAVITFAVIVYEATRYYLFNEPVSTALGLGALFALVASIAAGCGIDWLGILTDPKLQLKSAK